MFNLFDKINTDTLSAKVKGNQPHCNFPPHTCSQKKKKGKNGDEGLSIYTGGPFFAKYYIAYISEIACHNAVQSSILIAIRHI